MELPDVEVDVEPYKIKMVEHIRQASRPERERWIADVQYNLFRLTSNQVFIDLLTDSGITSDLKGPGMEVEQSATLREILGSNPGGGAWTTLERLQSGCSLKHVETLSLDSCSWGQLCLNDILIQLLWVKAVGEMLTFRGFACWLLTTHTEGWVLS